MLWRLAWYLRFFLPDYYGEHTHGDETTHTEKSNQTLNIVSGIFSKLLEKLNYDEEDMMAEMGGHRLYRSVKILKNLKMVWSPSLLNHSVFPSSAWQREPEAEDWDNV